MKNIWKILTLVLAIVTAILLLRPHLRTSTPETAPPPQAPVRIDNHAVTLQDAFSRVAEQCSPAVVVIRTGRRMMPDPQSGVYNQLYNYFHHGQLPRGQTVPTGLGSGFFVSPDGYILSNHHIVKDQDAFTVQLHNREEYDAQLIGTDPLSDLAVLKISGKAPFPYLEFADSEQVKVGHWAIAIGAPFNLAHTVTVGIVSHKRRAMGMNVYENFIQTDASINQGNSGGPLLNLEGKVIGVNDFILTPSAGNIGLSFSIASNLAGNICARLIKDGKIERPWLGISMAELSVRERASLKLNSGVRIAQVVPGGAAQRKGLKDGDIILSADGVAVHSPHELQLAVINHQPGEKIAVEVFRDGERLRMELETERMPDTRQFIFRRQ